MSSVARVITRATGLVSFDYKIEMLDSKTVYFVNCHARRQVENSFYPISILARSFAEKDGRDGFQKDDKVQKERHVLYVIQVMMQLKFDILVVSIYLRPACYTRFHLKPSYVERVFCF